MESLFIKNNSLEPIKIIIRIHNTFNWDCYADIIENEINDISNNIILYDFNSIIPKISLVYFYHMLINHKDIQNNFTKYSLKIFESNDLVRFINEYYNFTYNKDIMLSIILLLYYIKCFTNEICLVCFHKKKNAILSNINIFNLIIKFKTYIINNVKVFHNQLLHDLKFVVINSIFDITFANYILNNIDHIIQHLEFFFL